MAKDTFESDLQRLFFVKAHVDAAFNKAIAEYDDTTTDFDDEIDTIKMSITNACDAIDQIDAEDSNEDE